MRIRDLFDPIPGEEREDLEAADCPRCDGGRVTHCPDCEPLE